jgi:hypothetical protein
MSSLSVLMCTYVFMKVAVVIMTKVCNIYETEDNVNFSIRNIEFSDSIHRPESYTPSSESYSN